MMVGWSLAYLLTILVFGYALTRLIFWNHQCPLVEQAAASIVVGAGGLGTALLWLSMLGVAPNCAVILSFGVLALILLLVRFVIRLSRPRPDHVSERASRITRVLSLIPILALIVANLLVLILAIGMPLFEWDSFVIWGLKAKVLYHSPLTPPPDYFTEVRFSYSHLSYPLLFPMLIAGAYAMIGQVNEELGKSVLPLLFAGQTLMAYVGARQWLNRLPALVVALLLIGAPFNVQFAGLGTADMALTTFRLASLVYLMRCASLGASTPADPAPFVLCALFTLFAALTKSEGLPLAVFNFVAVAFFAVWQRAWKSLLIFTAILTTGIGIWLVFQWRLPQTDEAYLSRLTFTNLAQGLSSIGTILYALLDEFADYRNWGVLWLILPIFAMLGFQSFRSSQTLVLWSLLLAHLGLYVTIYMITPWNLAELLPVTVPRLLLHVAPTAMLLVAAHLGQILWVAPTLPERV